MPQQQQSKPNARQYDWDDPLIILCVIVIVCFFLWATWYLFHTEISTMYVYTRYAQLYIFYIVGLEFPIWPLSSAAEWVTTYCAPTSFGGLCGRDFSKITWKEIADSAFYFNIINIIIVAGLCFWFFTRVTSSHPMARFSKVHNVASFVEESKELYPHLKTFGEIDLISMPLDDPRFGMSLTTRQFAFKHLLIAGWQEEEGGFMPVLDIAKTHLLYTQQLGRHWTQINDLSVSETLLFAIAIPRVAASDSRIPESQYKAALRDTDDMVEWCWSLFECPPDAEEDDYTWLSPELTNDDLAYPRSIIRKYIEVDTVQAVFSQHAFVRTIMFELFTQARRLGVLPPTEMRWLRFFDRETWYVLQTIMRQAAFAEAAASLSHYLYERKQSEAIIEPQISKAVIGLEFAIQGYQYSKERVAEYQALKDKFEQELKAAIVITENDAVDNAINMEPIEPQETAVVIAEDNRAFVQQLKDTLKEPIMVFANAHREWLSVDVVYLDTETTGTSSTDQIIQFGIVNGRGDVLFNEVIKPTVPVHPEARKVNNLSDALLASAPHWPHYHDAIKELLMHKRIGIYNADFDLRMMRQTALAHGLDSEWIDRLDATCFMKAAQSAYQSTKKLKLAYILELENVSYRGAAHDATTDAIAIRDWLAKIVANYDATVQEIADSESN